MVEGAPFTWTQRVKPGSVLEKEATTWAERNGWFSFKVEKTSKRGIPDRYYLKNGRTVLVEFKGPRETIKPQQEKRMKDIVAHGGEAWVCRSIEYFQIRMSVSPRRDHGQTEFRRAA